MSNLILDDLPGFRRRFIVTPAAREVRSDLEDDYHCMSVIVHHDNGVATRIEPVMERAPWTTCPGAIAQLIKTFTGVPLDGFAARGGKTFNCTHLFDLAVLAAAHAYDREPIVYDVLVSDPVAEKRYAEVRRDGEKILEWAHERGQFVEPAEIAGLTLNQLGPWIESLDPARQEAARILRWGTMIASGRTMPWGQLTNASSLARGNCYTFQPSIAVNARRIGEIKDFSKGTAQPLDGRAKPA
jgi:Protein of unknown function (DUF2889)